MPFHERCAHHMEVYGPGWSIVELIQVETKGVVGVGETIQGYTWGHSGKDEFARGREKTYLNCCGMMGYSAGLQMALWDAAGKALGVPCHRLMGPQYRDACPYRGGRRACRRRTGLGRRAGPRSTVLRR